MSSDTNRLGFRYVETYPIGTEVWYFDPELEGDCPIKKSMVLGSFLHKNEGELFYFLLDKQVQGYAVWDNELEAKQMRDVFILYRAELLKANEENSKRYKDLRCSSIYDEYNINRLAGIQPKIDGDEDAESESSANDA